RLRRPTALVRAKQQRTHDSVVPELREVSAVAALCADDARSGAAGVGLVRPGAWPAGARAGNLRARAAVLLPAARAADPPGGGGLRLGALRRHRLPPASPHADSTHTPRRVAAGIRLRTDRGLCCLARRPCGALPGVSLVCRSQGAAAR